jgi:hypothetical protein
LELRRTTLVGTKRREDMDFSRSPTSSEVTDFDVLASPDGTDFARWLEAESWVAFGCDSLSGLSTALGVSAIVETLLICADAWI